MIIGPLASTAQLAELLERESEMSVIRDTLDSALAADGRAVLITGDPGIGKTTLLSAATEAAGERGFRVLSVRADSLESELAFGVCAQLFGELTAIPPGGDDPDLFAGAAANAQPILGGITGIPPTIGEDRILSLIHGLYWLCSNLSETSPLLLVVDDAHWADAPSLRFMHYLARRMGGLNAALLVGTRPTDRGTRPGGLLAALAGEEACTSLEPR